MGGQMWRGMGWGDWAGCPEDQPRWGGERVVRLLMLAVWAGLCFGGEEISLEEYRLRRQAVRDRLQNGVTILAGAEETDIRSRFFQGANFYYLTGWDEPGAILAITPSDDYLFIPRRDAGKERWEGPRADPFADGITGITGFRNVHPVETFESWLASTIEEASRVYTLTSAPFAARLEAALPLRQLEDASRIIARLRMDKSAAEQALIRRSVEVTVRAHREAWKLVEPGRYEYEIAAAMSAVCFAEGCERHAYAPIVGSGPNSAVLHYNRISRRFDAGELVVADVGAECAYYAADITRTVPVNGRFTQRQRELYDLVLGAQRAVIQAVKPGMTLGREGPMSLYRLAKDYFDEHGKDSDGNGMSKYFTHGIGHHIGLDVHDAWDSSVPLAAGMVITVEPGLYLPEENLGIRIEDMVLVTEDGCEVLSKDLPKSAKEIEEALR